MTARQRGVARKAAPTAVPDPLIAAPADAIEEAHAVAALVPPEARAQMIAEAAYYRAEARGFEPGRELDDWFEAEMQIDRLLAAELGLAS
ncbi:MAG: DUF2934 domain-containing protein [Burkholderiales bacterium]|jgi:hypothetical protein|nr:DUF2934 domain-containing protein [Burkholderiales bacterium]